MREPLDRVVAIFRFMLEWIPFAFRRESPAHILRNTNISCRSHAHTRSQIAGFVVRSSCEYNRKLAIGLRAINIRAQRDAIAHFHRGATLDDHSVRLVSAADGGGPQRRARPRENQRDK